MQTLHVLFAARTAVTARELIRTLQATAPQSWQVSGSTTLSRSVNFLVRWGNGSPIPVTVGDTFQEAVAVRKTSDKLAMLRTFKEHGVPCPRWYSPDEFATIHAFPIIVRDRYHFKGKGFWVVNSQQELQRFQSSQYYAVEIVDVADEFRVFVCQDKIMEINKKIQDNQAQREYGLHSLIKNHRNGWVCRRGGFEVPDGLRSAAKKATMALGLDFSACDIYVTTAGVQGVFEANTAPGLVERKVQKLAGKIWDTISDGREL